MHIKEIIRRLRGEQDLDKLRARGLRVGRNLTRMAGVVLDPSHCWHISIGDNVTLAPGVHILAHDASTKPFLGHTRVADVSIGNNVFIGAHAIILPGVTVGDNVIIGAGSVVTRSVAGDTVVAGNPARPVCTLADYLARRRAEMQPGNTFAEAHTLRNPGFGTAEREQLLAACRDHGCLYVE